MVLILGGIYLSLKYVMLYMLPFVLGIFLAFMLEPIVTAITRRTRIQRALASMVTVFLLITSLVSLVTWSVAKIAEEITDLYRRFPEYRVEFDRIVAETMRVAGDISSKLPESFGRSLQEQWNRVYDILSVFVSGAGLFVRGVPSFLIMLVFTFLSTYFFLRDRKMIGNFIGSLVSPRTFKSVKDVELDILGGIAGFVRAQALLIAVTMIINVIALTVLGCRYAVALGLILALLDTLPLVGPGLIYLPWVGYQFIYGSVGVGVSLLVLYATVSLLRQVAQTHLVGREMGLHPLVALMSVYIGFRLFGGLGLIYGPLVAIFVKGLWVSGVIPHEGGAIN